MIPTLFEFPIIGTLPIIPVTLFSASSDSVPALALIDTGATISVISQSMAVRLGYSVQGQLTTTLANNQKVSLDYIARPMIMVTGPSGGYAWEGPHVCAISADLTHSDAGSTDAHDIIIGMDAIRLLVSLTIMGDRIRLEFPPLAPS